MQKLAPTRFPGIEVVKIKNKILKFSSQLEFCSWTVVWLTAIVNSWVWSQPGTTTKRLNEKNRILKLWWLISTSRATVWDSYTTVWPSVFKTVYVVLMFSTCGDGQLINNVFISLSV